MKTLDMSVGIYNSTATITRHKNGNVTLKVPYVRWLDNTGTLDFEKRIYSGSEARFLSGRVFVENASESLAEFLSYH